MRKIRSNPRYYSYLFSFQHSSNFFLAIVQKYTIKKRCQRNLALSTIIPIQNRFLVYCKILYKFRLEACFLQRNFAQQAKNLYVIILPSFFNIVFLLFSHIQIAEYSGQYCTIINKIADLPFIWSSCCYYSCYHSSIKLSSS